MNAEETSFPPECSSRGFRKDSPACKAMHQAPLTATFEVITPACGGPNIICNGDITFTVPQFVADEVARLRAIEKRCVEADSRPSRTPLGAKEKLVRWIRKGGTRPW